MFAFVQIQQHLLRWRAEQLLDDIRAIEMGKSTWADAQRLMNRWGAWGGYQNECDQQYCSYRISIDDISRAFHHFPFSEGGQWESELRWPKWINRPYSWAGGRFAVVEAKFEVRNGKILGKSFAARTAFSTKAYQTKSESYAAADSNVIAEGLCATSFAFRRSLQQAPSSIDNQEVYFTLSDNDHDGHWAVAAFTPFADEGTVNTLLTFDLGCITRWKECRTSRELMPAIVSIYKEDKPTGNNPPHPGFLQDLPLWVAARNAEYVAIAEVLDPSRHASADQFSFSFQARKLLKGYALISMPGSVYMVRTEGAKGLCSMSNDLVRNIRNGTKVLVIFDEPMNEESTPKSENSPCIAYPMTDENLVAVQRGIARYSVLYPAIYGSDR
jgi:hypothetical protein